MNEVIEVNGVVVPKNPAPGIEIISDKPVVEVAKQGEAAAVKDKVGADVTVNS